MFPTVNEGRLVVTQSLVSAQQAANQPIHDQADDEKSTQITRLRCEQTPAALMA